MVWYEVVYYVLLAIGSIAFVFMVTFSIYETRDIVEKIEEDVIGQSTEIKEMLFNLEARIERMDFLVESKLVDIEVRQAKNIQKLLEALNK